MNKRVFDGRVFDAMVFDCELPRINPVIGGWSAKSKGAAIWVPTINRNI